MISPAVSRVADLYYGVLAAGNHAFCWDGVSEAARRLPSGVYFGRVTAETDGAIEERSTRVLILRQDGTAAAHPIGFL